jgi:hypothetical protein
MVFPPNYGFCHCRPCCCCKTCLCSSLINFQDRRNAHVAMAIPIMGYILA